MNGWMMLLPIALPLVGALGLALGLAGGQRARGAYVIVVSTLTSLAALALIIFPPAEGLTVVRFAGNLFLRFDIDGLSRIFAAILALLWPLTAIYGLDYMKHDKKQKRFFAFFLASYGVALGIAFAGNLVTMYLFFELLTFATLPLVMHFMNDAARFAGRRYLIYSMAGASLGLIGVVFLSIYGGGEEFQMGGSLLVSLVAGHEQAIRTAFTLAFFGFAVKAAMLPMSAWLPSASVAPTPVTALLHAVAVVKAGVFACIRLTYYSFGTDVLKGTFAQYLPMFAAGLTILLGSFLALRSNHIKRRLAWSTASNLSYILFAVTLMSPDGLTGGLLHMIFHAFIKITLFFCAGAVLEKAGKEYIDELGGMARVMPVTFGCFVVASLALAGLPGLPAFFSKWDIGSQAVLEGSPLALAGAGALIVSAVLTVLYLSDIIIRAYFPLEGVPAPAEGAKRLESRMMSAPIVAITAGVVLLGVFSGPIKELIQALIM